MAEPILLEPYPLWLRQVGAESKMAIIQASIRTAPPQGRRRQTGARDHLLLD
jgi:hypothetical protein